MLAPEAPSLRLRISDKAQIATDIFRVELVDPAGCDLPEFSAGAHLDVIVPSGAARKYSLSNDPSERERYVIGVKREAAGGGGSRSLVNDAQVGDTLLVGHPRNDFPLAPNATNFLFIAGGVGITPIMSMMRDLKSTGRGRAKLYYLTRDRAATAFADELCGPQFKGQVTIHHDQGDPDQMLDLWPILEKPAGRHLYCCGPRPLMEAVRDMSGHWSSATVHFEDFGASKPSHKAEDVPFRVRLARSGLDLAIPVDRSILETARDAGVEVSYSCESGTCGSCRTRLIEGEAEHRDLVLSEGERATNIMICVSRAKSPELVLDL